MIGGEKEKTFRETDEVLVTLVLNQSQCTAIIISINSRNPRY